jgi:hypothetical protein
MPRLSSPKPNVTFGSNVTDVNCRYGAPMGRQDGTVANPTGPVTVSRVKLDEGGYDEGGAYWGIPDNLFKAEDDNGFVNYFRAQNRMKAQEQVLANHPGATLTNTFDGQAFVDSYLEAAIFVAPETDEFSGLTVADFAPEAREQAEQECAKFIEEALADLATMDEARAGHCFFLNRNHHGSGFWDERTIPKETGERLSNLSHKHGERDIYVGDDGKIYFA